MGQAHSNDYDCEGRIEDVADSEINSGNESGVKTIDHRHVCSSTCDSRCSISRATTNTCPIQEHVRKLSNVSHRNIQLLSIRPRGEKDAYADDLRSRRRSSLINLILGAPSSGPRFCDDLCSINSHLSEVNNFGIEFFPDSGCGNNYNHHRSTSTLRLESIEDTEVCDLSLNKQQSGNKMSHRLSVESSSGLALGEAVSVSENPNGAAKPASDGVGAEHQRVILKSSAPSGQERRIPLWAMKSRNPSLASIDLTRSFERHDDKSQLQIQLPINNKLLKLHHGHLYQYNNNKSIQYPCDNPSVGDLVESRIKRDRVNQSGRILHRSGSELSLYSTLSANSANLKRSNSLGSSDNISTNILKETKLIILLQVALPFILAGFGNMSAGLVLDIVSQKAAFVNAPIFFVLLPPLIGLKGNIEMTLASRLSTQSNLNLLQTSEQKKRAFISNLVLVISQAIGLSLFAALVSILCELSMLASRSTSHSASLSLMSTSKINLPIGNITLAVFACALTTSVVLVLISSVVMSCAVGLANLIQVNPDNLSTLIAALYGDVTCVYVYGLVADWTFSLASKDIFIWPTIVVTSTLFLWPITLITSYKLKETHSVALYSIPPMIMSIMISMGSGALLSKFVGKFKLIALYQPVVNGFGANLIAVQGSRVSTWLWCSVLRKEHQTINPITTKESSKKLIGPLASFTDPEPVKISSPLWSRILKIFTRSLKLALWSFCNPSPNAIAAKLLLIMLIPAHTMYFFVIWFLSSASHVVITWQFYTVYIGLCLVQVFILLTVCEPFMTLLMKHHMDPDVFGISILMALADLIGTICLTAAFFVLAGIGDINAIQ